MKKMFNLTALIAVLLVTGTIIKETNATGSGCWVASTAALAPDTSGTVGNAYCKTTVPSGAAVEVASSSACTPSATESCCVITASGNPCNKVTTCNNPKGGNTVACDNSAANKDHGCAILISDGTGICIGLSASTNVATTIAANNLYFVGYAKANVIGGTAMTCWNPTGASTVACTASQWTCQTTLSSGSGACTTTPGTTSSTMYYCSPSTATPNNCNNFGPAGVGFTCWDPSQAAQATACTSSQWQCATTSAGVGSCIGTAPSTSYTCATTSNCNQISTCWNPATGAVLSPACTAATTKSCQTSLSAGVYTATCQTGTCTPSATGVTPVVVCCYYTNCNKLSSAENIKSNFLMMFATSLMLLVLF